MALPTHFKHASKPSTSSSSGGSSAYFPQLPPMTPQRRKALLLLPLLSTIFFLALYSLSSTNSIPPPPPLATSQDALSSSLPYYLSKLDTSLREAFARHPKLASDPYPSPIYPVDLTPSQLVRYAHLIPSHPLHNFTSSQGRIPTPPPDRKFLLTSSLVNVAPLTPTLFTSLIHLTALLGPRSISLSLIEGPSNDGTSHLIEAVLCPILLEMGVDPLDLHIVTRRPKVDFETHNRIEVLAKLREEAMIPFWRARKRTAMAGGKGAQHPNHVQETVVFFNDVYYSAGMMLELIHQHLTQGSDMTCAWDLLWGNEYVGSAVYFGFPLTVGRVGWLLWLMIRVCHFHLLSQLFLVWIPTQLLL